MQEWMWMTLFFLLPLAGTAIVVGLRRIHVMRLRASGKIPGPQEMLT